VNTLDGVCSRWWRGDVRQRGYSADCQRLGWLSSTQWLVEVWVQI